jgi:hypothetical protein
MPAIIYTLHNSHSTASTFTPHGVEVPVCLKNCDTYLVGWLGFIGSVQSLKPDDKSRFVKIPAVRVTKDNFLQYAQWRALLPGEYAVGWLVSSGDRLGVYGVLDGRGVPFVR